MTSNSTTTAILFSLTYLALAMGRIPGLQVDRAGIAFIGMTAMLAGGVMSLHEAAGAIDYETIALLTGMMILVAYLQIAGFFRIATDWIVRRQPGPYGLLAMTMGISGVLSALLVNDVVCVALTPLILDVCRRCRRPPIPFLIGLATASNVGSVATITGNPQNMIIGSLSGITYFRFAACLTPIALLGLAVNFIIVATVYRRTLQAPLIEDLPLETAVDEPIDYPLLYKGSLVTSGLVVLFFVGQPVAMVALAAAAIMLLGRIKPEEIYRRIDWPLLVMFIGLFVVVHGFDEQVVQHWGIHKWKAINQAPVEMISGLALVLSNLVSNVPAVLLFKPIIKTMENPEQAWLTLAMSSTFAGNLTLLGSVANLIVVENARRAGIEISLWEYLKVGVPITILTTLIGVAYLHFV